MQSIRWGILATGNIAGAFARGLKSSRTGSLHAVSSRALDSAEAFAKEHGAAKAYPSHSELLADPEVDAVYIATPHPFHVDLAVEAAQAGKHILCEKPLAMNMEEIDRIIAAAKQAGVTLVEAYMYRCHPQTEKAVELIREGTLGQINLVQANFGYHAPFNPQGRHFAKNLGGGGILDVGGYPASFACMVADAMGTETNVAVKTLGSVGTIHPETDTDTLAITNLSFANGLAAQLSASTQTAQSNQVRIYGSKGWLEIDSPWIVNPKGGDWHLTLHLDAGDGQPERITGHDPRGLYGIEADCFAEVLEGRVPSAPCMTIPDTIRVNQILADWQEQLRR